MDKPALIASAAEPLRERPFPEGSGPGIRASRPPTPPPGRPADPTLSEYLWTLRRARWTILAATGAAVALAALYLALAPRVYRGSTLLQVEHRLRAANGIDDQPGAAEHAAADAEIENLRSRVIVGGMVDALHLDRIVGPRTAPVVGELLAGAWKEPGLAPPPARWLAGFAWGGERIAVDELAVGADLLDRSLALTALGEGRYRVDDPDGQPLLEGRVGERAQAGEQGRQIALRVTALVARPGSGFVVRQRPRDDAIDDVRRDLRIQEKGKASGVLLLELDGADPVQLAGVLNGIAATFLRRDVERKNEEASRKLSFVESQLPGLRRDVESAEAALNAFRMRNGTVNLTEETRSLLTRAGEISREVTDLELSRSELQGFRDGHPSVVVAKSKLGVLQAEQEAVAARLRALPQAEATLARLETAASRARDLFDGLNRKAQELRLAKAATIGDGWVIDPANPPAHPVSPRPPFVIVLAMLVGLGGATAAVILRAGARRAAEDAEEVEGATGVPVLVAIPHSDRQAAVRRRARRGGGPVAQLFDTAPGDRAIEAVRTLRAAVQVALAGAPSGILAVTSPVPAVGRSFVVANLASALAGAGSRVLLVDADLRQGRLQRLLGLKPSIGLSGVLGTGSPIEPAIVHVGERLHVLPAGEIPGRPAELLAGRPFQDLLLAQAARYDVVLVNTPPVLPVADALAVGRLATATLMVVRAGAHGGRELALAAKQLQLAGVQLQGFVLNDVRARDGRYGRGGRDREYALDWSPARS